MRSITVMYRAQGNNMQDVAMQLLGGTRRPRPLSPAERKAAMRWHSDLTVHQIIAMRNFTGGRFMVVQGGRA